MRTSFWLSAVVASVDAVRVVDQLLDYRPGDVFVEFGEYALDDNGLLVLESCGTGNRPSAHVLLDSKTDAAAFVVERPGVYAIEGKVSVVTHDGRDFNGSFAVAASAALFCDPESGRGIFDLSVSPELVEIRDEKKRERPSYNVSWTSDEIPPPDQSVCLAIHCSSDRLRDALHTISEWRSVLVSLAVWGSIARAETPSLYNVTRVSTTNDVDATAAYPINYMRNLALAGCPPDKFVLLTDADVSISSRNTLQSFFEKNVPLGSVFIVPTFEGGIRPNTKTALMRLINSNRIFKFKEKKSPKSYALDVAEWELATAPYRVEYSNMLEPFVVFPPSFPLRFDERFVGFGGNKISFFLRNELDFYVLNDVWLMHKTHHKSQASKNFVEDGMYRAKTRLLLLDCASRRRSR